MKTNTSLIVLATTKTGENSIVLHTLSKDYGRRSFVARCGKDSSMFLPLNILDADIWENPRSTLWRATDISLVSPLVGIRSNMYKNTMSMFMSEVLYRAIREEAYEEGLFEWCEKSILTLDALPGNFSNYHLRFLLELCVNLGFSPTAEDLAPFAGGQFAAISEFMNAPFAQSMLMPMSGHQRSDIAEVLLRYLGHHLEVTLNIRSLDVLREVWE